MTAASTASLHAFRIRCISVASSPDPPSRMVTPWPAMDSTYWRSACVAVGWPAEELLEPAPALDRHVCELPLPPSEQRVEARMRLAVRRFLRGIGGDARARRLHWWPSGQRRPGPGRDALHALAEVAAPRMLTHAASSRVISSSRRKP